MLFKKYIIAVSGGPDSMALLNKKRFFIKAVCHINYHDREDTDNDELIVKNYCKKYKIPIFVFDTRKDDISKYQKISNPQSFYREIRYDFFIDVAKKIQVKKCFIAHNKDDFLESVYMTLSKSKKNLFLGIRRKAKYKDLVLVRPLLHKRKKELEKYCVNKGIRFAVDYSNFSDIYLRNIIRKKILSFTKKETNELYYKAKLNNIKNHFLIKMIDINFKKWVKNSFDITFFLKQSERMKNYLIYNFLVFNNLVPNQNKIDQICSFVSKNKNHKNKKKYRLKNDLFLVLENKKFILS